MHAFLHEDALIERLALAVTGSRPVVFMVGSAVSKPRSVDRPGVPLSRDIVEMIRHRLPTGALKSTASYQEAFLTLIQKRGPDAANAVIQDAVLAACKARPEAMDERTLGKLEADWTSWEIPTCHTALAALAAHHPATFGNTVLTTNFDPLLEVAFSRAGVPWHSTALHSDGSLLYLRGSGTSVVHLHGHWWGSDTLHTPRQLGTPRPQLAASLKRILANAVIVVVGYGGWEDVFTAALGNAVAENDMYIDLLWAFHGDDESEIYRTSSQLLERLKPAADRGRAQFFKGIDVDSLYAGLFGRLQYQYPAETIGIYLDRVLFALARPSAYEGLIEPWGESVSSFSNFITPLSVLSKDLPARAALFSVELMLPYLEAQLIHQAPNPRRHAWVRQSLERAHDLLGAKANADWGFVMGSAIDALRDANSLGGASQEKIVLEAAAYAFAGVIATTSGTCNLQGCDRSADYWAGRAVHLIARSSYDQNQHLAVHLKSRLAQ